MTLGNKLKSISKKLLLYCIVTLLPALAISYLLTLNKVEDVENQYKSKTLWYANFHAMNIDNFLGETIARLDMLATSIKIQHNNLSEIEKILKETHKKDPRFSGFYWANLNGDLIISTNPTSSILNVGDRAYFQQALKTRNTSISEAHIGRITGRNIITIVTPVELNGQIKGAILASLRLDKIEEAVKSLVKEEKIVVTDRSGKILIKTDSMSDKENIVKSSISVTKVPWKITAQMILESNHLFQFTFLKNFISLFTITNILLLLTMYLLLRQKVKKEKAQNERQKLELIGNLAASTAHEIKNPLTGIKGLVELMSEEQQDEKTRYYFDVIQTEIERINVIVSELLVLGKPTANRVTVYNVNEIMKEIEPIIHSEAKYTNVDLSLHYSVDKLSILCVKDHMKQVILNLTKNALQAMPNGGKLRIILEKQADSCIITIEDNGIGMPKEYLKQVFDPFFSMKKDGTGLGLTVCKRIIDSFDGEISIQSTPNEGTRFEIKLPLV